MSDPFDHNVDQRESDTGEIDLDRFAQLSLTALRGWIVNRLEGREIGDRDGMPHFLVNVLYRRSSASTRENIRTAILSILREWSSSVEQSAIGAPLLMLAPLFAHSPERAEAVDILLDVTHPGVWMAHCHIAEHHESGMMFSFRVDA